MNEESTSASWNTINRTSHNDKPAGTHAFVDGNKFFILGEFNEELKKEIILPLTKKVEELSSQRNATIDIYLNSPGGYCYLMWHIVELIEMAKRKEITVRTIVMSGAYSAASVTAVAGTPGERYIDSHAEHLPHYGTQYGYPVTTPLQIDRTTAEQKRHFKRILDHYRKYTKIPDLEKKMKDDLFFIPAKQSIRWGLADKLVDEL